MNSAQHYTSSSTPAHGTIPQTPHIANRMSPMSQGRLAQDTYQPIAAGNVNPYQQRSNSVISTPYEQSISPMVQQVSRVGSDGETRIRIRGGGGSDGGSSGSSRKPKDLYITWTKLSKDAKKQYYWVKKG